DGNEINAGRCDSPDGFQRDAAARFELDVVSSERQSFPNLSWDHVVQENSVDATDLDESPDLLQIVSLHFDSDVWPFLTKAANLIGKSGKTSESGWGVLFYENHVVQPGTVINPTTSDNRGLFQHAQARSRFAGVEYLGRMISHRVNELAGKSRDTAQALKKIQCHAFGLENRTRKPAHFDHDIARNYGITIGMDDLNVRRRIDIAKNFRGRPRSRAHRWLFATK